LRFYAKGSVINESEKRSFRLSCISTLSEDPVGLDEGDGPRRKQQASREMGDGIRRFSAYAFG
jgi:hypothetical protein